MNSASSSNSIREQTGQPRNVLHPNSQHLTELISLAQRLSPQALQALIVFGRQLLDAEAPTSMTTDEQDEPSRESHTKSNSKSGHLFCPRTHKTYGSKFLAAAAIVDARREMAVFDELEESLDAFQHIFAALRLSTDNDN